MPMASSSLGRGLDLESVLALPCLAGARVVAGKAGLGRRMSRINVMEVPDIAAWVKPDELLLTTGYALRQELDTWAQVVADLAEAGLAGIAFKVGRYVEELPAGMLDEADRRGLPIIELPAEVAFDDVISQVLEAVLDNETSLLARGDEALRSLLEIVLTGGDLHLLCDGLVRILGGAVLVTAVGGEIVVEAGDPGLLDRARGLSCFDQEGFFHPSLVRQDRAGGPAAGGLHVAAERIVAGGVRHGHLVTVSEGRSQDEEHRHILERAAPVAALVITRAEAVAAVESKYRADFLRDVLTGRSGTPQRTLAHALSLGWDLERPLVVVVAQLDGLAEDNLVTADLRDLDARLTRAWTRAVATVDESAPVAGFSDEAVALLPVPSGVDHATVAGLAERIAEAARGDRTATLSRSFSVGVSRVVEQVGDLAAAYEQAHRALTIGRKVSGDGTVLSFDALGVYRLLALVDDPAELSSFAAETLGRLVTEPSPEHDDLLRTLSVLLDTGMNVAEAARMLHFHYNTLRNRITRIEAIVGPFTSDAQLRLRILLALQVLEMRGV